MKVTILSDNIIMNIGVFIFFILFNFLLFMSITYFISLFKKKEQYPRFTPAITVVIPAYNEEQNIGACLTSIVASDYPHDKISIIVVDDRSTDGTAKKVKAFQTTHPAFALTLIKGTHQGKSPALNVGVSHAKTEYVVTIDADVILKKNTLVDLVAPLKEKNVAATNCIASIHEPRRLIEHFQAIEYVLNNIIRVSFSSIYKNSIWFFGAVAAFKKDLLAEVGGFKTHTLTEDMDISLELFNRGYRIVTVPTAIIATPAMPTIGALFKQRMRWYYGALQALSKNRKLLKKPSAPILFLFFNQFWWTFYAFIFFPLICYQVWYWLPTGMYHIAAYIFRWFSLSGPFYVIYKIPEWGLSFLNIFGVASGLISFFMMIAALYTYRIKIHWKTIIAIFFYFPYTILLNAIVIAGVIRYRFSKKKYFVKE